MSIKAVRKITQKYMKDNIDVFSVGDRVIVHFRIIEGATERVQLYEGIVISKRGEDISKSFTVRKISFGIGVERIFPLHSPRIEKITLVRQGKVRRAKLYYMRNRIGKAAMKIKEVFVTNNKKNIKKNK